MSKPVHPETAPAGTRFLHSLDAERSRLIPGDALDHQPLTRAAGGITLELPDLRAGDLIVPSFASLTRAPYRFRFRLALDGGTVTLGAVPSRALDGHHLRRVYGPGEAQLDSALVSRATSGARLRLEAPAHALDAPCWISVAVRPARQTLTSTAVTPAIAQQLPPPPPISQMLWPDPPGAQGWGPRICSPTATTMALQASGYAVDWQAFVRASRDRATGLFGVWPLAIYQASRAGALGTATCFSSWAEVLPWLEAGFYIVASIRYATGALPNAPQPSSGGHLVLLYGVDGDEVLVNDPAAPDGNSVPRRYASDAFARAWFAQRGAAYLFLPARRAGRA